MRVTRVSNNSTHLVLGGIFYQRASLETDVINFRAATNVSFRSLQQLLQYYEGSLSLYCHIQCCDACCSLDICVYGSIALNGFDVLNETSSCRFGIIACEKGRQVLIAEVLFFTNASGVHYSHKIDTQQTVYGFHGVFPCLSWPLCLQTWVCEMRESRCHCGGTGPRMIWKIIILQLQKKKT